MTPKAGGSPGRGGVKKYIMLKNAGGFFCGGGGKGGSLFLVPRGRAR